MASQTNTTKTSRFELPALDLNFGNITDGTNIPPPPDSPIQKEPTPPQTPQKLTKDAEAPAAPANGSSEAPKSNGKLAGTKRAADDAPLSPPLSTRQGSLRRLFSRNTLNNSYLEGQQQAAASAPAPVLAPRPMSQGGASLLDGSKSKKSSSWFKRLRGGDSSSSRRASVILPEVQPPATPKTPAGPPPPMIPELTDLEKDDGGLGADLFKNIK